MTVERPVEIELKYRVLDVAAALRLLGDDVLGPLRATGPARSTQHEDHYVDTADGALARAGFAARLRQSAGGTIISVKSLRAGGSGALHRRDELEGSADRSLPPHGWPGSAARSLILELAGDAPLVDLVTLRQLRRKRRYAADGTDVELSLDEVDVVDRGRIVDRFTELEIELVAGDPAPLDVLQSALDAEQGLTPSQRSKFELALEAGGIPAGRVPVGAAIATHPRAAAERSGQRARPPRSAARGRARGRSGDAPLATPGPAGGSPTGIGAGASTTGTPAERELVAVPVEAEETTQPAPADEVDLGADPTSPLEPVESAESGSGTGLALPAEPSVLAEPAVPRLVVGKTPGVQAEDTLAEAGRKVLRFHLARMLVKEPGTRVGADAEELHGMRVATRRMRAAWRVFGDAYRPGRIRRYRRDLRDVAGRLGAVRDLDVLIEGLATYQATVPEVDRAAFEPLMTSWRTRREEARILLLRTLDSARYGRFVEEYREFVNTDGLAVLPVAPTTPHRVRDSMPSRIWAAYEHVRAYEPVLRWADVETLHELRIAAKWLRYTIEFVREPLGPDVGPLIERIVALQDHLGYLHDADVAAGLARAYLVEHAGELSETETAAVARYLVERERELQRLRRTVGAPWRRVAGLSYRRALGRIIAGL